MANVTPNPASKERLSPGFFDLTMDTLSSLIASWREPAYRAGQIMDWVYRKGATDYSEMTNLSKALRQCLVAELPLYQSAQVRNSGSQDGTLKLLLKWQDGATSECVLIPDRERRTACVSTQVGCAVSCVFCASGLEGLTRNLSAGEMVEQAMRIRSHADPSDARLSNIVFMGLGEPLANYDATVRAIRTINAEWGMGIGARKITVSTVGLPSQMRRLAREGLQITLALSLHAPTDELRRTLIPWAENVTIEALIEAANDYFKQSGREVTLEYVLLGGINDSPREARQLIAIARRIRGSVNLIPYNPVEGLAYQRPTHRAVEGFAEALRDSGVNAQIRRSRGSDVAAACGQLRRRASSDS